MMSYSKFPKSVIFNGLGLDIPILILLLFNCVSYNCASDGDIQEPFDTIVYHDLEGLEREEYAFREPARGLPDHVLDMFCASVKLRLYWNEYRDQVKESHKKGLYLRRMARLARHIFKDVRDADKPFNASMLSRTDDYFNVKIDSQDDKIDKAIAGRSNDDEDELPQLDDAEESKGVRPMRKIKGLKNMIGKKIVDGKNKLTSSKSSCNSDAKELVEEVETSDIIKELESSGNTDASTKIKQFVKQWGPKVVLGIYTRWRTMWWMTMSCLYTKFYLWDPALDEFIKLKRSLVMWPELQVTRMQDLHCKPLMFFRRLMDVCKVLNPLMNKDFGQFNLDKLTRFKSDS